MVEKPAVLFVCMGNICRSPLAEGAFRHAAERAGLAVVVDSAGTGAWHSGEPPDPRAEAVARGAGVDISAQRARQVTAEDFDRFDLIVALDHANRRNLEALRPEGSRAEICLMLDHMPGREGEAVADPYYGGPEGFAVTWAEVTAAAERLVRRLSR